MAHAACRAEISTGQALIAGACLYELQKKTLHAAAGGVHPKKKHCMQLQAVFITPRPHSPEFSANLKHRPSGRDSTPTEQQLQVSSAGGFFLRHQRSPGTASAQAKRRTKKKNAGHAHSVSGGSGFTRLQKYRYLYLLKKGLAVCFHMLASLLLLPCLLVCRAVELVPVCFFSSSSSSCFFVPFFVVLFRL